MSFLVYLLRKILPYLIVLLAALFIWRSCKDTLLGKPEETVQVTHSTVLNKIEGLGKMELVRYNFKDVVEYKKELSRWLPNSRSVLIVAGEAVGCIDMSQISRQDIQFTNDSTITIKLPAPEICYFKVDHEKSKIFAMEYTYFQDATLVDEAYKYAEKNVRQSALNAGILEETARNADKILKPMLEGMTGKTVVLVPNRKTENPVLPPKR
ncbi:DUF4230 domain-containing protein [Adhaeribacter rhizoryzae]|uniref:DUF4230 domain-containing protein n=1 Tax=Adhaeribacter rhizoryzae TaxID=2607907 RepID=A0A5M6DCZ9_9BACT|nr:DUF4230 domain-containing protein [Adhaeribacter rhizoryzae]KAA5543949.1 DUF4230 domain-containing protein [Adhaeribacter rhizoryzae]